MMLNKSKFKINLSNPDYMFEELGNNRRYDNYKNWDKLIKKIISI